MVSLIIIYKVIFYIKTVLCWIIEKFAWTFKKRMICKISRNKLFNLVWNKTWKLEKLFPQPLINFIHKNSSKLPNVYLPGFQKRHNVQLVSPSIWSYYAHDTHKTHPILAALLRNILPKNHRKTPKTLKSLRNSSTFHLSCFSFFIIAAHSLLLDLTPFNVFLGVCDCIAALLITIS